VAKLRPFKELLWPPVMQSQVFDHTFGRKHLKSAKFGPKSKKNEQKKLLSFVRSAILFYFYNLARERNILATPDLLLPD